MLYLRLSMKKETLRMIDIHNSNKVFRIKTFREFIVTSCKRNTNKGTEDLNRTFFTNSDIIRKCKYKSLIQPLYLSTGIIIFLLFYCLFINVHNRS